MIGQCWHCVRCKYVCGVEVQFHALLTSTLSTGESLFSHSGGVVPAWRAAGTHRKGSLMVPRAGLSPLGKEKNLSLCRESNNNSSLIQLAAVTILDDLMFGELLLCRKVEASCGGLRYYPGHHLAALRETTKEIGQVSLWCSQNSKSTFNETQARSAIAWVKWRKC